jgi:hypothetical protein
MAWTRRNAVALLALFVALGGTGYAATSINGKVIKNGTIAGKKLKKNTLGGTQVKESKLATVPRSARANSAAVADTATSAGGAPPTGAAGGDLAGSFPAPSIAAAPTPTVVADNPNTSTDPCAPPNPQTGVYCGTSTRRFLAGASSSPGISFWRDRLGEIHIRGGTNVSTGTLSVNEILFILPPGARPAAFSAHPVGIGQDAGQPQPKAALLFVDPDGGVKLFSPSAATEDAVYIGEIQFRTDG